MAWTIDQNHAMGFRQEIAERAPHHLEIRACTMQHDDRRISVARSEIDDVQRGTIDLDHLAFRRESALHGPNAGLRCDGQRDERGHDENHDHGDGPGNPGHIAVTILKVRQFLPLHRLLPTDNVDLWISIELRLRKCQ